jgi:arginine exporter protein ArgO
MPVGAMSVLIVTLSAHKSLRVGFAGAMGVASADGLYALLAVVAGTALVTTLQSIDQPLQWLAIAVLAGVAVKGLVDALRRTGIPAAPTNMESRGVSRTYLGFVGLTLLNPLTVVYFTSYILGRQAHDWPMTQGAVFVIGAFAASVSWQSFLAIGGSLVGRTLTSGKGRLITAIGGNGIILALVAQLAWSSLR